MIQLKSMPVSLSVRAEYRATHTHFVNIVYFNQNFLFHFCFVLLFLFLSVFLFCFYQFLYEDFVFSFWHMCRISFRILTVPPSVYEDDFILNDEHLQAIFCNFGKSYMNIK